MFSHVKLCLRSAAGVMLAPIDGVYGLLKGSFYFIKYFTVERNGDRYFYPTLENNIANDAAARVMPVATGLARVAAVNMGVLCVLGSLDIISIPGITAIQAGSFEAITKTVGIAIGWTVLARGIGAFVGAIFDYCKINEMAVGRRGASSGEENREQRELTPSTIRISRHLRISFLEHAAAITLLGEAGHDLVTELRRAPLSSAASAATVSEGQASEAKYQVLAGDDSGRGESLSNYREREGNRGPLMFNSNSRTRMVHHLTNPERSRLDFRTMHHLANPEREARETPPTSPSRISPTSFTKDT